MAGAGLARRLVYIGDDFGSFFSSVVSGAAGTYMATLTENQDVHTDPTIQPGQAVLVSGDPGLAVAPTWGSGSFTVGELASLSLNYLQIDTLIQVEEGASYLSLNSCILTYSDETLVLRASSATFVNVQFPVGGLSREVMLYSYAVATAVAIQVPAGSSVSITDSSMVFGTSSMSTAGGTLGIWIQNGATASISRSSIGDLPKSDESDQYTQLIRISAGGALSVEASVFTSPEGPDRPFPCDGGPDGANCSGPHVDRVVLQPTDTAQGIWWSAPLICAIGTAQCQAATTCPPDILAFHAKPDVMSRRKQLHEGLRCWERGHLRSRKL